MVTWSLQTSLSLSSQTSSLLDKSQQASGAGSAEPALYDSPLPSQSYQQGQALGESTQDPHQLSWTHTKSVIHPRFSWMLGGIKWVRSTLSTWVNLIIWVYILPRPGTKHRPSTQACRDTDFLFCSFLMGQPGGFKLPCFPASQGC